MWIYVIVLVLILCIIFRDTIIKVIKGKKTNFYKSQTVKSKTYEINPSKEKDLRIDVLDTDIKILGDKDIKNIIIQTDYLVEECCHEVTFDEKSISIVRDDKENYKEIGHTGRILIKIPEKVLLNKLGIVLTNGDIEIYDINFHHLDIRASNGWVKIDNVRVKHMNIFKTHGDLNINSGNISNIQLNMYNGNGDFVDVYGENMDITVVNGDFIYANRDDEYKIRNLNVNVENGKKVLNVKCLGKY